MPPKRPRRDKRDPIHDHLRRQRRLCVTLDTLLRAALGLAQDTNLRDPIPVAPGEAVLDLITLANRPTPTEERALSPFSQGPQDETLSIATTRTDTPSEDETSDPRNQGN